MPTNIINISQNPIFIVGFPRSGTTLLQSMLATQDNVYSFQETHFFCTTMRFLEVSEKGYVKPRCLRTIFQNIKLKTEHQFSTGRINEIGDLAVQNQLTVKMLFEYLVADLLLKQVNNEQLPNVIWIEKTPGHIFQLGIIQAYYPNARFIEIIRNPLNAIYSSKVNFIEIKELTASALAHRWKNGVDLFEKFMEKYPEKAFSIKYEDLANDTELTFRKICDFLKIIPDLKKLELYSEEASKVVLKREVWKKNNLNTNTISGTANYKWPLKEELKIKYILKKELDEMGYSNGTSLIQKIYNCWMSAVKVMANQTIINPLKKPTKYLARKSGLWPYQTL